LTDVVELTRALLAFDTTNPPGREADCAAFVARHLETLGLDVEVQTFDDERANVVARWPGEDADARPLMLAGHLDTVPLGMAPWSVNPFAGEIREGRLYGRGVSDMKAGVAAMIAAVARTTLGGRRLRRGLTVIFTSGEETGCAGALRLLDPGAPPLGLASAMIVGEPTANRISTGHKGCVAVHARAGGVTAHSSMPQRGTNAIYRAAQAVGRVERHSFETAPDALLGAPTINVGMIRGGLNYNSVPDEATFTVDVRTTPGMDHDAVQRDLAQVLGEAVSLKRFVDMPPVFTAADEPFVELAFEISKKVLGDGANLKPLGIPFFSDASVLTPQLGCPTVILGPGEPDLAHQTDEYCRIDRLLAAVDLYEALISAWCG
jgi:succinyl-diaminopimelate desuccinylase